MTNTEILAAHPEHLGKLDRQRRYVLEIALTPQPCPVCNEPATMIEASGLPLDKYRTDDAVDPQFVCPNCRVPLEAVVPFMGPPYLWRHMPTAEFLRRLAAADTANPGD